MAFNDNNEDEDDQQQKQQQFVDDTNWEQKLRAANDPTADNNADQQRLYAQYLKNKQNGNLQNADPVSQFIGTLPDVAGEMSNDVKARIQALKSMLGGSGQ